jgi:hypothetical protein
MATEGVTSSFFLNIKIYRQRVFCASGKYTAIFKQEGGKKVKKKENKRT